MNRRARLGVVIVALLVFGIAYATNASSGRDGPPVTVLSAGVTVSAPGAFVVATTTSSTVPADDTAAVASTNDSNPTSRVTTTTTEPPASTSTTTRPPITTTTSRPATTTTTTTTIPPTTTTVPPTTTTTVPPTTTTTTTLPPTTTTTIPQIVGTIHIHELKGEDRGGDDEPYARIEVQIRNDRDRNQRGVLVIGQFSGGEPRQVSGTTNNKGKVIFESGIVDTDAVTFTVINLVLDDYAYAPQDNRRGPSVTVEFD